MESPYATCYAFSRAAQHVRPLRIDFVPLHRVMIH